MIITAAYISDIGASLYGLLIILLTHKYNSLFYMSHIIYIAYLISALYITVYISLLINSSNYFRSIRLRFTQPRYKYITTEYYGEMVTAEFPTHRYQIKTKVN